MQYRYEHKHIINFADARAVSQKLGLIMQRDANSTESGNYFIRSLYFDTPEDKALGEKLMGVSEREKFRIRLYNHDDSFIRLEKKSKSSGMTKKEQVSLSRQDVSNILKGDIQFLKDSETALKREFYIKLTFQRLIPKVIVDYEREAFYYPAGNVRITIDGNIRSGLASADIFNYTLPSIPVMEKGKYVLEVKYDEFMPGFIKDLIQLEDTGTTAASKYMFCRSYI